MTTNTFHVAGPERNTPLIEFLARKLSVSKKKAKQLLDARVVFINRQRVWMARHPLERGDIVEVQAPQPAAPATATLKILYRDGDFVAIDKPPALLSNGPRSAETLLREQLGLESIEAVHRLDRDTSGCLLFALHAKARDAIIAAFREHELGKTYRALVYGAFPPDVRVMQESVDGKPARTSVRLVSRSKHASLLELSIETGRTHQIRKHLARQGHPVLGDKVYAIGEVDSDILRRVGRQMLHATELSFVQPITQAPLRIRSPLPADFAQLVTRLKL
jgi:23S rRNA pseudouridine1911/1915/1917 synthase